MDNLNKILVCYTTISDKESSESLIKQLLESKSIACGVCWPAGSQYNWQDQPVNETEYVVLLKTALDKKETINSQLTQLHPYDVPSILFYEVECNAAYGKWVESQTR